MTLYADGPASKLFSLCTSCKWEEVVAYIHAHPKETKELQRSGKRGAARISALQVVLAHSKCRGDVPLEVVQAILEAAPSIALERHKYTGNLPLHAVFYNPFYSASKRTEIATLILHYGVSSAWEKNHDDRTPLHTICSQHCNFEPLSLLLSKAKCTASWPDKNGDLPLHLACRSLKSPNKSIAVLYKAYPCAISHKNGEGMTPLDIVCDMLESMLASGSIVAINKCRSVIQLMSRLYRGKDVSIGSLLRSNASSKEISMDIKVRGLKRKSGHTEQENELTQVRGNILTLNAHPSPSVKRSPTTICDIECVNKDRYEFKSYEKDVVRILVSMRSKCM